MAAPTNDEAQAFRTPGSKRRSEETQQGYSCISPLHAPRIRSADRPQLSDETVSTHPHAEHDHRQPPDAAAESVTALDPACGMTVTFPQRDIV